MFAILKLLLALGFGAAVYLYYGTILPGPVAAGFAVLVVVVLLWGFVAGKHSLSLLAFGGPVIVTWPLAAILYKHAAVAVGYELSWAQELAGGWWLPLAAYKIEFMVSEKRERARDIGGLALGVVLLYTVSAAVVTGDMPALAVAAIGTGAGAVVVEQHLLIAPDQVHFLRVVGAIALVAAGIAIVRVLIA